MAVWFRDHLDHELPIVLSGRKPFAKCTAMRHDPPRPFPVEPAAAGHWPGQEAVT
jgi:hypothetical protein